MCLTVNIEFLYLQLAKPNEILEVVVWKKISSSGKDGPSVLEHIPWKDN